MNTEPTPLELIERDLKDEGFGTHLLPVTPDNLYERLLIAFGRDEKGRDYFMHLFFVNDLLNAAGESDSPDDAYLLQCTVEYPFQIKAVRFDDISRLLLAMNPVLPIGALGLNEDRAQAYYHYVLTLAERKVKDIVINEVVNLALFYSRLFAPLIEAVAEGQRSRTEVLNELQAKGLAMPPTAQAAETAQPTIIRG